MNAEIRVSMELKEVQDALVEKARNVAGANSGGSRIEFQYANDAPDEISGAVVTFQHKVGS